MAASQERAMKTSIWLCALLFWPTFALSQTSVVTYHYDNSRTGQNTQEPFLTPANVRPDQFRRLFIQPNLDGDVYAQPLYLPNVPIAGKGIHNVVFVATQGDSLYAFDADNNDGANATYLWKASVLDPAHGAPQCPSTGPPCVTPVPTGKPCRSSI
jgi:hypothetical protein